jgi:hypothetical protein
MLRTFVFLFNIVVSLSCTFSASLNISRKDCQGAKTQRCDVFSLRALRETNSDKILKIKKAHVSKPFKKICSTHTNQDSLPYGKFVMMVYVNDLFHLHCKENTD